MNKQVNYTSFKLKPALATLSQCPCFHGTLAQVPLPQARMVVSPTRRMRSKRPRVGPQGYAIHRCLLVQLTSSLKDAARDDHRQNLIFSPLKNRGENPTSKKIDLRCHRDGIPMEYSWNTYPVAPKVYFYRGGIFTSIF